jgi:tRNA (uracil-5-)-methyltransferase
VHFLGSSTGDMVISLIYTGAPFPPGWRTAAEALRATLSDCSADARYGSVSVIGRCKGSTEVLGRGFVEETIPLRDGRRLTYRQVEGSFSNPSAAMCGATLDFLCACAGEAAADVGARDAARGVTAASTRINLLELYCGNGNHTVALGRHFALVLAVEIDRKLCEAADVNLRANGVENCSVLCASSGKFCGRLSRRIRKARGAVAVDETVASCTPGAAVAAADTDEARWMREATRRTDVVLVDPPRCGLDAETRELVQFYDHILYVSCNPQALLADLDALGGAYEVLRLGVFDHFAYSQHLEVGVHLRRKRRGAAGGTPTCTSRPHPP